MVATILFLSSFSTLQGQSADTPQSPCREKAERLLNEALSFMQKNYYRRDLIQWDDLAASARFRLRSSVDCDDAYNAVSWCFKQLNENHSFVMPPAKAARYNNDPSTFSPAPPFSSLVGEIKGEWLNDSIAYLTVPWVNTADSLMETRIADSLQEVIARLDSKKISKWIIDLRKNSGGNCWPMLAGVGPLLGDGICGYFVSEQSKVPISYRDGAACQGRHIRCRVSRPAYITHSNRNQVIVLTGRGTVSAGEIVALAFKGRNQVYLYGEPTAGLTTANATYSLSDHSMLVLTVCQEADHTGKICEGSIAPDKYITAAPPMVTTATSLPEDTVKTAAIRWFQNQF